MLTVYTQVCFNLSFYEKKHDAEVFRIMLINIPEVLLLGGFFVSDEGAF